MEEYTHIFLARINDASVFAFPFCSVDDFEDGAKPTPLLRHRNRLRSAAAANNNFEVKRNERKGGEKNGSGKNNRKFQSGRSC